MLFSHSTINLQNCVRILLKPLACNVLIESDRITLSALDPDYLRAPYTSCCSTPFQTLISSNPSLLTRVENHGHGNNNPCIHEREVTVLCDH